MTEKTGFTLMQVHRLVLDPNTNSPIVILRDEATGYLLPIWIGIFEAHAIAMRLEGVEAPRPMTHDMLANMMKEMSANLYRVEVVDLVDNTYFARLYFQVQGKEHTLDSRPSDAIALALRMGSPLFVADPVLERSRIDPAEFKMSEEDADLDDAGEAEDMDEMELEAQLEETDAEIRRAVEDSLDEDEYTRILKRYNPSPDKDKLN